MKIHVSMSNVTEENFRDDPSLGLKENREYERKFMSEAVGVFWHLDFACGDALCDFCSYSGEHTCFMHFV